VRFGVDGPDCSLRIILKEESKALGLLAGVTDDPVPGLGLGLDFMRLDRSCEQQQRQDESKRNSHGCHANLHHLNGGTSHPAQGCGTI